MESENVRPGYRNKLMKSYEKMEEREVSSLNANRLCNTIFCVGELVKRSKVFKKREKEMRIKLVKMLATGKNSEAFGYATGILMVRKKIANILDLSSKTIDFTNFFQYNMNDMDAHMFYSLERISYFISNGTLLELGKELKKVQQYYEYPSMRELKGMPERKTDIKVTKKTVRAFMKKIRNDPKIISMITMETSKPKSGFFDKAKMHQRSSFFKF